MSHALLCWGQWPARFACPVVVEMDKALQGRQQWRLQETARACQTKKTGRFALATVGFNAIRTERTSLFISPCLFEVFKRDIPESSLIRKSSTIPFEGPATTKVAFEIHRSKVSLRAYPAELINTDSTSPRNMIITSWFSRLRCWGLKVFPEGIMISKYAYAWMLILTLQGRWK